MLFWYPKCCAGAQNVVLVSKRFCWCPNYTFRCQHPNSAQPHAVSTVFNWHHKANLVLFESPSQYRNSPHTVERLLHIFQHLSPHRFTSPSKFLNLKEWVKFSRPLIAKVVCNLCLQTVTYLLSVFTFLICFIPSFFLCVFLYFFLYFSFFQYFFYINLFTPFLSLPFLSNFLSSSGYVFPFLFSVTSLPCFLPQRRQYAHHNSTLPSFICVCPWLTLTYKR